MELKSIPERVKAVHPDRWAYSDPVFLLGPQPQLQGVERGLKNENQSGESMIQRA